MQSLTGVTKWPAFQAPWSRAPKGRAQALASSVGNSQERKKRVCGEGAAQSRRARGWGTGYSCLRRSLGPLRARSGDHVLVWSPSLQGRLPGPGLRPPVHRQLPAARH